jgi:hypothetical protein
VGRCAIDRQLDAATAKRQEAAETVSNLEPFRAARWALGGGLQTWWHGFQPVLAWPRGSRGRGDTPQQDKLTYVPNCCSALQAVLSGGRVFTVDRIDVAHTPEPPATPIILPSLMWSETAVQVRIHIQRNGLIR